MNTVIDGINAAMPELPRPAIVGVLVRPQAYDKVCSLLRGIEEAYPLSLVYADPVEVVTHPRYQLEQAMLFSSRESMRKFLETLDEAGGGLT